jgi:uncharacterized protein YndB with AHSA1/START domain
MKTIRIDTEIEINASRKIVADYVSNPDNEPEWFPQTSAVVWKTEKPLCTGSIVDFYAYPKFMGTYGTWLYSEVVPHEKIVLRLIGSSTVTQPELTVVYTFRSLPNGATQFSVSIEFGSIFNYLLKAVSKSETRFSKSKEIQGCLCAHKVHILEISTTA